MMQGERFEIDVGSDDETEERSATTALPSSFVKDVLERKPAAPKPPSAPTLRSKTGFPEHRNRDGISRFKRQQDSSALPTQKPSIGAEVRKTLFTPVSATPSGDANHGKRGSWEDAEKVQIDKENRQKLAQMSPEEIEEERRELMSSLSPDLLQRLLRRADLDSGSNESDLSSTVHNEIPPSDIPSAKSSKTVKFEEPERKLPTFPSQQDDTEGLPADAPQHDSLHFPQPSQPPDLDPSSNSFFDDLHQKYFPSLPSEPDKLEWMQSSTPARLAYDPSAAAFNASEIRFSFKGELIPPKTAAEIPVTAGLHHHGDAPDAAGYTIAELAHLARSTYPAQRCIAFQTLGRILYRLSKGEFGDPGEPGQDLPGAKDTLGELSRGLWREVEKARVIHTLMVESEGNGVDGGRHVSAKAYATEAVWLWQRGGGRRWKAG